MAETKKAAAKKAPAQKAEIAARQVEVTITDAPGTTPIVVSVNGGRNTFKVGEPKVVGPEVLEALSRVSGITYEEGKVK